MAAPLIVAALLSGIDAVAMIDAVVAAHNTGLVHRPDCVPVPERGHHPGGDHVHRHGHELMGDS